MIVSSVAADAALVVVGLAATVVDLGCTLVGVLSAAIAVVG
jgi:hypothetical protein